jgi:RHS repeat-associated protein
MDRASFYSADNRLRTVEMRSIASPGANVHGTWEEYRYDALGRRVWVRTLRFCAEPNSPRECSFSTVQRTVWEGDQVLYEIRMAESDQENDTIPAAQPRSAQDNWDPNPLLGRVLLTHGVGIDQPLSAIRMGYNEYSSTGKWSAFAVVPLWDSRGRAPYLVFGDGKRDRTMTTANGYNFTLTTGWLLAWDAYGARNNGFVLSADKAHVVWMGEVMEDQKDASGLLYRRNRYYDPQSGRFTQEDPIGLAGGVNLYGFANSDPVTYSDPYGLSAEECCDRLGFEGDPKNVERAVQYSQNA